LVAAEQGDVGKVNAMVEQLGGPNATVTQTPVLLRDETGKVGSASLFSVQSSDGQTYLVDGQGAKYSGMQDYLENNQLPENWTMVHPANPGVEGTQELVTGPAHQVSQTEQTARSIDKVAGPVAAVGDGMVLAAGVAELASAGTATPGAAVVGGVGETLSVAGGVWSGGRTVAHAINEIQHGRDAGASELIDLTESVLAPGAGRRILSDKASAKPNLPEHGPLTRSPHPGDPPQNTPITRSPAKPDSTLDARPKAGEPPRGAPLGDPEKVLWTSWSNYPKVTENGKTYAKIGDHLYPEHAVQRMQPSGLGPQLGRKDGGRGVSPTFVEDIIRSTPGVPTQPAADGTPRMKHSSGSVEVITEGVYVVTVMVK
jgi:uncharacterized protein DUF4781